MSELALSQQRWRGDEGDHGLTWGTHIRDNSFASFMLNNSHTNARDTIVEIGPGYGRILKSVLWVGIKFEHYIGLEISTKRVERLRRYFDAMPNCTFVQADILELDAPGSATPLTFGSAVFEHLYPDFGKALRNIRRFTRPGGMLIFDLIRCDDELCTKSEGFEIYDDPGQMVTHGTYTRVYALDEVTKLLGDNGFALRATSPYSLGIGNNGCEIKRIAFACQKV